MWIFQEPNIEHIIGFSGHTALEGERRKNNRKKALLTHEIRGNHLAQFRGLVFTRIDHQVRYVAQIAHQFALMADTVDHCTIQGQRVAATRFGKASAQDLIVAIQE